MPCLLELYCAEESAAAATAATTAATAATAFRRLPPFRESVVPWLASAERVALGAAVIVSAASSSGHGSFDSFESS